MYKVILKSQNFYLEITVCRLSFLGHRNLLNFRLKLYRNHSQLSVKIIGKFCNCDNDCNIPRYTTDIICKNCKNVTIELKKKSSIKTRNFMFRFYRQIFLKIQIYSIKTQRVISTQLQTIICTILIIISRVNCLRLIESFSVFKIQYSIDRIFSVYQNKNLECQ